MSYQVIARKWRPQTFEDVTGQEPITRTLRNALEYQRLHHAYLFSGARGVGKTTTARLLAKALNCHKFDRPSPIICAVHSTGVCASCLEIAEGRSIDVQEIDAASNTGVDNVRDTIIGTVAISPARDRYKVFIIDEVHMLSTQAFNALLKTLEEPPPRVVFIMATTERQKIPSTILSRCQLFEFRTIATPRIAERLRLIAEAENVSISNDALLEIARAGEGSMRDAQSAFDQVISFSGTDIQPHDVEIALGITGSDILIGVMGAVADQKTAAVLKVVDDLVMRGHDLRSFCRDLLGYIRNLLVANVSGEASELLESFSADRPELTRQASAFSESDLVRFFHSMSETENTLRTATHPRYQLEIGLVKLIEMRRLAPLSEILCRLANLEQAQASGSSGNSGSQPVNAADSGYTRGAAAGEPTTSRMSSARGKETLAATERSYGPKADRLGDDSYTERSTGLSQVPSAPLKSETSVTPALQLGSPESTDGGVRTTEPESTVGRIKSVLEERHKMFLVAALDGARRVRASEEELCIEFSVEKRHLRDNLAKPESITLLREACQQALGRDLTLRITVNSGESDDDGPLTREEEERREKQRLRKVAEQDPGVQSMLKKFRGQILDVRQTDQIP